MLCREVTLDHSFGVQVPKSDPTLIKEIAFRFYA
ncbi:Uncharacterised protein [uncultured archaeon]|nr:Uncharacterised protein [uncultured archaeon]